MDYAFEVSGSPKMTMRYKAPLESKVEALGGVCSWNAQEYAGCGRRIRSSRCVFEIRFPHEAISGAAVLIEWIVKALPKRSLRIDSIFYEPSTISYRSPSLGPPECELSSSPPRHGRQRPATGAYSEETGVLVQAIADYLL